MGTSTSPPVGGEVPFIGPAPVYPRVLTVCRQRRPNCGHRLGFSGPRRNSVHRRDSQAEARRRRATVKCEFSLAAPNVVGVASRLARQSCARPCGVPHMTHMHSQSGIKGSTWHPAHRRSTLSAIRALIAVMAALMASCGGEPPPAGSVVDHPPGPNPSPRAGGPLPGLSVTQLAMFKASQEAFNELSSVTGGADSGKGLGPRFNLDSCSGCHGFPAAGGSSGFVNPEPIAAHRAGATNDAEIPFLHADGPIVEARFKWLMDAEGDYRLGADAAGAYGRRPDGSVHPLFTIGGRSDAQGCENWQPPLQPGLDKGNVSLRIPTPLFGLGLIEAISDSTIAANTLERMKAVALRPNAHDPHCTVTMQAGDRMTMYERLHIIH